MRGNLRHHLDEERKDEFGVVESAFNRIAKAIAQQEQIMEQPREAKSPLKSPVVPNAIIYQ